MIKVVRSGDQIKISGHAGFDTLGKDIVCASVSSIIYTTVNGILNINSKSINFSDNDEYMEINIISNDDVTQKLINNMMDLLSELESKYPDNIMIKENN